MTDTFNWKVLEKPTGTTTQRVRGAQFGDGYEQTVADGLNATVKTWPVQVKGDEATISAVKSFLDSHVGVSFYWTPPGAGAVQGYYQSRGYTEVPAAAGTFVLAINMKQQFKP